MDYGTNDEEDDDEDDSKPDKESLNTTFNTDQTFSDVESESDDDNNYESLDKNHIYNGSNISVTDFGLSFLVLCKRINITTSAKNILLDYIRTILPPINKIPSSYGKIIKHLSLNSVKKPLICNICLEEICTCKNNIHQKKLAIFEFDVAKQISSIITLRSSQIPATGFA